jgi:hypothetical protein
MKGKEVFVRGMELIREDMVKEHEAGLTKLPDGMFDDILAGHDKVIELLRGDESGALFTAMVAVGDLAYASIVDAVTGESLYERGQRLVAPILEKINKEQGLTDGRVVVTPKAIAKVLGGFGESPSKLVH